MLVRQLEQGRSVVENQYARSVRDEGNVAARAMVDTVFEVADRPFRGLGIVPRGGLRLREAYARWDAERRFDLAMRPIEEPGRCRAAEVLQGLLAPMDCPELGRRCTPESPLGAPMVSTEGACAAYFRYRRRVR
jgi:hydrogenase expression/formation protein HypD